jgi:hypothetical protein
MASPEHDPSLKNPYAPPKAEIGRGDGLSLPLVLGIASVGCGLASLLAWLGYATYASRAVRAAAVRTARVGDFHNLAAYAGRFAWAHLALCVLAVGLGWLARHRGASARVSTLGTWGMILGAVSFLLVCVMA